jgi:YD repeat-containing protein
MAGVGGAVGQMQHTDEIRFSAAFVAAGAGTTGLTVVLTIQRVSDSKFWTGAAWQAGVATVNMAEPDSTNLAGLYEYALSGVDDTAGVDGYRFKITEATTSYYEIGLVHTLTQGKVLDEAVADHLTANTIGEAIHRNVALRHHNTRITNTAWNAAGQPTAGTIKHYGNKANTLADVSATGTYAYTATYDADGRLTSHVSTRET